MSDQPLIKTFVPDQPLTKDFLSFEPVAIKISDFIQKSLKTENLGAIAGIFGSFGSGKSSLLHLTAHKLSNCQPIWFRPTFYSTENEVAAAFFESALRQIQVEAKGIGRIKVKARILWHNLNLPGGAKELIKLVLEVGLRLSIFVGGFIALQLLLSGRLANIGSAILALFGSAAIVIEQIQKALDPGLKLDPAKFTRRIKATSASSSIEDYVKEFQWITRLARSHGNPLVIFVDPLDDGLPLQIAMILETLRVFSSGNAPCVFVVTADKALLRTAVHTRFLNQLSSCTTQSSQDNLLKMADSYLDSIIRVSFEMPLPSPELLKEYFHRLTLSSSEDYESA